MRPRYFKVAGHPFQVIAGDFPLENYRPFEFTPGPGDALIFSLEVRQEPPEIEFAEDARQVEENQEIICGKTPSGESVFEFHCEGRKAGTLVCDGTYQKGCLYFYPQPFFQKFVLDNSLMTLFALSTACKNTALFHAAAVTLENRGYMFLGESGTGKSTHARLWQSCLGAALLNDDNPVVLLEDDGIWVYGSPWSGKTACYKNLRVKLFAMVDLVQAKENSIASLEGLDAYSTLVNSISGMRWEKVLADGIHETENRLVQEIRMYRLGCLPDEDAARICYRGVL